MDRTRKFTVDIENLENAFIRVYDKNHEGLYRIIYEPVLSLYIDKKGMRRAELTEVDIH